MNILVVNGIPNSSKYFNIEKSILDDINRNSTDNIDVFTLRAMNINYCCGCWDCWIKTPGLCIFKDDHERILSKIPHADKLLLITPVILGYESSLLKTFKDRIIPIAHPYVELYQNEQHHRQRYKNKFDLGVLLISDDETTDEDISIIKETYERIALNFKQDLTYFNKVSYLGGAENVIDSL